MFTYDVPEPKRKRKTSDAQLKANKRYDSKFERISLRVTPELKDAIKMRADSLGKSMAQYLLDLALKDMAESR